MGQRLDWRRQNQTDVWRDNWHVLIFKIKLHWIHWQPYRFHIIPKIPSHVPSTRLDAAIEDARQMFQEDREEDHVADADGVFASKQTVETESRILPLVNMGKGRHVCWVGFVACLLSKRKQRNWNCLFVWLKSGTRHWYTADCKLSW